MIPRSTLHGWVAGLMGRTPDALRLEHVRQWQLAALRTTVRYAKANSPFYAERLANADPDALQNPKDISGLPFTTPDDLRVDPLRFLCVSQGEIERVVTMETSGTTGNPKRLFFTGQDLERTVDFFAHGMSGVLVPKGRVLLFMPGEKPGSVGDLLAKGLARIGASCRAHGFVRNLDAAVDAIVEQRSHCLVGLPAQVLAVARHGRLTGRLKPGDVRSVLLSGDPAGPALRQALETTLECQVFVHYGLTETGLGGGVECRAHAGAHLREADLLAEIVHPATGRPLPDGAEGEIVLTTLAPHRGRGMPLIRYRTGDLGRLRTEPCPCGTPLPRLLVRGRAGSALRLGSGRLSIWDIDEALWPLPELSFHQAGLHRDEHGDDLRVTLWSPLDGAGRKRLAQTARNALRTVPPPPGLPPGLRVTFTIADHNAELPPPGKRRIQDHRNPQQCKEVPICPPA